jgi:hypothetical protein
MIDQVRNERRTELAFESLRLDDIKRWKIAEVVLNHPVGDEVRGAKFADRPEIDSESGLVTGSILLVY